EAADAADADEAERLPPQLTAHELAPRPFAAPDARVRGDHVAHERERERERVLRSRMDVPRRCVHDVDAARRGGRDDDVVDPDARPAHDLELWRGIEERGGHLRLTP